MFAILKRYIGAKRPSPLGRILAHKAMNPSVHLDGLIEALMRPELERIYQELKDGTRACQSLARRITQFSLAGIEGLRPGPGRLE